MRRILNLWCSPPRFHLCHHPLPPALCLHVVLVCIASAADSPSPLSVGSSGFSPLSGGDGGGGGGGDRYGLSEADNDRDVYDFDFDATGGSGRWVLACGARSSRLAATYDPK